ncbi:MAG: hypothetical protein R2712_01935 [Vicinamibacterales bacterium]
MADAASARILAERGPHWTRRRSWSSSGTCAPIGQAIQQARAALDADPANTYLNSHTADARRRKLELLRQAAN